MIQAYGAGKCRPCMTRLLSPPPHRGNAAYLGWIPKNARILPNSFVKYGAMGEVGDPATSASFKVGTLGDDDKFGSVSNAKNAGTFQFTSVDNNKVGESGPLVITIVNAGSGSNVPVGGMDILRAGGVRQGASPAPPKI